MVTRRDRGTAIISDEERLRRVEQAKGHIREEAAYTPALMGRIESRIDANAFRRCISDNTIYQSLCNSLKDKNLPERERCPDLVDFLALEAITQVQYDGEYNRVLKDLYIRCHTETWVAKAVLKANHDWFRDQLADAKNFIRTMINKVDSQLLEIILEDLETSFWREKMKDNVLYQRVYAKVLNGDDITQRDVLTVVALNGGKYPTEIFRHLVVHQNSSMLNYGNNLHAQHALYEDPDYQSSAKPKGLSNLPPITAINDLETLADAIRSTDKAKQMRQKIRELKDLMGDDSDVLHAVQSGRIQKASGSGASPRPRLDSRNEPAGRVKRDDDMDGAANRDGKHGRHIKKDIDDDDNDSWRDNSLVKIEG